MLNTTKIEYFPQLFQSYLIVSGKYNQVKSDK